MKVVELKDVKRIYKSGKIECLALNGVSLTVNKGDLVAIIGPSGSGKTTMLNLIGCLDKPQGGRIFLDGEDITDFNLKQLENTRRKKLGFIFQTFNLMQALSVYENVEFPLLFSDIKPRERRIKVEGLLEELGLKGVAKHRVTDISGGQQQRTAIGRALIKDPLIILADEPTGNLDSETSTEILNLMERLNQEKNTTFLFATHSDQILDYVDAIFKLKDGRIITHEQSKG